MMHNVNIPEIRYYAKFENTTAKDGKTPKFTITTQAGYYPPMQHLIGRDGKISVFLTEKLKEGMQVPAIRLQAKNSLNLTGLKDYFIDSKLSGFAYGNPPDKATYSAKEKPNPFFEYRKDGFLFIIEQDRNNPQSIIPVSFEMIVLAEASTLTAAYCKMLCEGGFDDTLKELRTQASKNAQKAEDV